MSIMALTISGGSLAPRWMSMRVTMTSATVGSYVGRGDNLDGGPYEDSDEMSIMFENKAERAPLFPCILGLG